MDIDTLFEKFETPNQKDLKLNFKKFFLDGNLTPKEAGLIAVTCAEVVNCAPLSKFALEHCKNAGATPEEISEAKEAAAIMGLMNTFYRFRHFVGKEEYQTPAGLRMNIMGRPVVGKETFEMLALAASVINGCEACVKSHEQSLVGHGVTTDKIYDLVRLAAIVKALEVSFRQIG
jgi:lipoyl-dependent peroxiredoxin subunit D